MTSSQNPIAKICTICGNDCSRRERIRDKAGRYYCKNCYDCACQKRAASRKDQVMSMSGSEDRYYENTEEEEVLPWDGDDVAGYNQLDSDVYKNAAKECPGCGKFQPGNTIICTDCGLNWQTGKKIKYKFQAESKQKVDKGADLPEYRKKELEFNRHQAKLEYTKPVFMIVIGLFLSSVLWASQFSEGVAVARMIGLAAQTLLGIIAFWLCSILWIGFNQPFHLIALKLIGIYAISELAYVIAFMFIPVLIVPWVVVLFVSLGLMVQLLDLDITDAVIFAIITIFLKIALFLTLIGLLLR